MPIILFDTVTLEHFAAANQLSLLKATFAKYDEPRWVEQVQIEVTNGAALTKSRAFCEPVLELDWLGTPVVGDLGETLHRKILLGGSDDTDEHLGEAESIVVALEMGAVFVTDDAGAYDHARHRAVLGPNLVKDSCELLWMACGAGHIDDAAITQFHNDVFDVGRTMRCRCARWPGADSIDDRIRKANWR